MRTIWLIHESKSVMCNIPTQAKGGLEWATGPEGLLLAFLGLNPGETTQGSML